MTQANCPNGASLQDCHTNFFALVSRPCSSSLLLTLARPPQADLSGIKWRRLRPPDHQTSGSSQDPLEDPVLSSYSKCLTAGELLCAWTRVERPAPDGAQPPAAAFAKELWVFWYSKDPDFAELLSSDLNGESLS